MSASQTTEADAVLPKNTFSWKIEKMVPAKVSGLYKTGLVLVAVMMFVLPLLYIGLIGGLAYWSFSVFSLTDAEFARIYGRDNDGIVFFGAVIGMIAVFFLIKPLFARRAKAPAPMVIQPGEEPALESFVHSIADAVGARRPREIEVDTNANAAAGFRRGFRSLFTNDLKLIVGLPLAGGMDLRSFGGVLAHEFGHFAQGTGMRLTYLIRSVNAWFARVVYERDAWDERLARWSRGGDIRIMIFLLLTRLFIWLSRRVLWVLMHIGHGISCFAMRQMEYDADSYEIQFGGSAVFPETSRQLQLINIGGMRAQELVGEAWEHKRLAKNLPQLGVAQMRSLPKEVGEAVDKATTEGKTGIFDTHPSDADRIAAAKRLNYPGIFTLTEPATSLFRDFEALSEKATRHFYKVALELPVEDRHLVDNALIEGDDVARREAFEKIDAYFYEGITVFNPVFVSTAELKNAPDVTEADRVRLDAQLKAACAEKKASLEELGKLEEAFGKIFSARALLNAKFRLRPADFGLAKGNAAAVDGGRFDLDEKRKQLLTDLEPVNNLAKRRLVTGLELRRMREGGGFHGETERLAKVMEVIRSIYPQLEKLRELVICQTTLFNHLSDENSDAHIAEMRSYGSKMESVVSEIRSAVAGTAYPFEHPRGQIDLEELIRAEGNPQSDEVFNQYSLGEKCLNQLFPLYFRSLGRLAQLADEGQPTVESNAA